IFNHRRGNIIPVLFHTQWWAHEIGHDLWRSHFNHLPNVLSNDVPAGPEGPAAPPTARLAYTLMAGGHRIDNEDVNTDMAGTSTISAYERSLLGWVSCYEPTSSES